MTTKEKIDQMRDTLAKIRAVTRDDVARFLHERNIQKEAEELLQTETDPARRKRIRAAIKEAKRFEAAIVEAIRVDIACRRSCQRIIDEMLMDNERRRARLAVTLVNRFSKMWD